MNPENISEPLRAALAKIISAHSLGALERREFTLSLLKDYLPTDQKERLVNRMRHAYEAKIVAPMVAAAGRPATALELGQWRSALEANDLDSKVARQLLETLAAALKIQLLDVSAVPTKNISQATKTAQPPAGVRSKGAPEATSKEKQTPPRVMGRSADGFYASLVAEYKIQSSLYHTKLEEPTIDGRIVVSGSNEAWGFNETWGHSRPVIIDVRNMQGDVIESNFNSLLRERFYSSAFGISSNARNRELHYFTIEEAKAKLSRSRLPLATRLVMSKSTDYENEYHLVHGQVVGSGATTVNRILLGDSFSYLGGGCTLEITTARDLGNGLVALLIGGHLAIYDTNLRRFRHGPVDISGPGEKRILQEAGFLGIKGIFNHKTWDLYNRLLITPDSQLLVCGYDGESRATIKAYRSIDLSLVSTQRFASFSQPHGIFPLDCLPDSRHVLGVDRKSPGRYCKVRIALFDLLKDDGCLGYLDINEAFISRVHEYSFRRAKLIGGGRFLVSISGQSDSLIVLDLLNDELLPSIAPVTGQIFNFIVLSDSRELCTISTDGAIRKWDISSFYSASSTVDHVVERLTRRCLPLPSDSIYR